MVERPAALNHRPEPAPFAALERRQDLDIANEIERITAAIKDFADEEIRCAIFMKPGSGVGAWTWCDDATLPIDLPAIMAEMKERFGPGNYELRVTAKGRVRANSTFSIAKEKAAPAGLAPAAKNDDSSTMTLFQIMLAQQADARREAQQQADRQMQIMQQSNQQTMQLFAAMSQQTTAMMTAMMGGREKASDFLPLLTAMQPQQSGMKDAVETLVALKGLLPGEGGGGGGFDADDLVGSAARLAGPVLGAIGRAVQQRQTPPANGHELAAEPTAPLTLPGGPAPLAIAAPVAADPSDPVQRVLRHIADDVIFMFARGYDPALAAEAVYGRFETAGVGEQELNDLVAAFYASPDWIADLAARGVDLRADRQWAQDLLQALVSIHTSPLPGGEHHDPERGGGGEADASGHGAPGAGGVEAH